MARRSGNYGYEKRQKELKRKKKKEEKMMKRQKAVEDDAGNSEAVTPDGSPEQAEDVPEQD
ncbi:MAG: hypothetical protein JSV21_07690 [Nitrospirota bacterium]|nr:MAG: hypothetical protein JSV21_07690 [Nitrospirota bacterium]